MAPEAAAVHGAVEQIIDNYIDNALAATPAGGTVEVVVEAAPAGGGESSTSPARAVALHFDRFWRASGSATTGSGLGLAIVAQLASASGATATITTRPAGGIDAAVIFPGSVSAPSGR